MEDEGRESYQFWKRLIMSLKILLTFPKETLSSFKLVKVLGMDMDLWVPSCSVASGCIWKGRFGAVIEDSLPVARAGGLSFPTIWIWLAFSGQQG